MFIISGKPHIKTVIKAMLLSQFYSYSLLRKLKKLVQLHREWKEEWSRESNHGCVILE